MTLQIRKIIILFQLFCLPAQLVFSQTQTSKDNYTGAWETPASWNPVWAVPQTDFNGISITINGYITANGPVTVNGTSTKLIVNDTLVIKGNLTLNNNNNLTVNDNGILIVMGNFTLNNQTSVIANGYLVVAGDLTKNSSQGTFISNDNPVKVFIGGTISPPGLSNNNPDFPALNCTNPITTKYLNSTCSYGNIIDLGNDPIYPFFQSTCATATLTSSDADNSFCTGTRVTFTAGGGTNYNFRINGTSVQNGGSRTYTTTTLTNGTIVEVIVTSIGGCTSTATLSVTVNEKPIANAGPDQELKFVSETEMNAELSSSETGEWSLISGSGVIGDIHSPTTRVTELSGGENIFLWTVHNGNCISSAEVIISVNNTLIPSVITPNSDDINDYFMISEIIGQIEIIIFNRWGNEEYKNKNYQNDWDGRNNKGNELPGDTYFYIIKFEDRTVIKGSVLIIR